MVPRVARLYTYPVKGLAPHWLGRVSVSPGGTFPFDRAFALRRGDWPFDPEHPAHMFKTNFYMLMRDEALARVKLRFDEAAGRLRLEDGADAVEGDPGSPDGRAAFEAFFEKVLGVRAALLHAGGHSFCDAETRLVSFINLASVRELSAAVGRELDPVRFRGNVVFDSCEPWGEFRWAGKIFRAGSAVFRGMRPIVRCAATSVNPASAERDVNVPKALVRHFGHADMGLYAEVVEEGTLAEGDPIHVGAA